MSAKSDARVPLAVTNTRSGKLSHAKEHLMMGYGGWGMGNFGGIGMILFWIVLNSGHRLAGTGAAPRPVAVAFGATATQRCQDRAANGPSGTLTTGRSAVRIRHRPPFRQCAFWTVEIKVRPGVIRGASGVALPQSEYEFRSLTGTIVAFLAVP
ncbi:MAG: hypothetical protein U5J97_03445 [Trueperaceae bacterium]|nr:hypothetical protein [Trueperaceae bacterium]